MKGVALLLLSSLAAAQGVVDAARERQRLEGYGAAIDFLEPRLDDAKALFAYADRCRWGGEEERGLRGIRGARLPEADRLAAEVLLLEGLFRYREAAGKARRLAAIGSPEQAEWARAELAFAEGEAALRERLSGRRKRAAWAAAAGLLLLLGGAAWLGFRTPRSASGRASA